MKTIFSALACAYDKGFYLFANHPKGFRELSTKRMMDKHPGYVLYHIYEARGSIQDMILEASLAIYMNREVNIEFLDEYLIIPGKRCNNILMKNTFVLLALPEMAAQYRFLRIVYFAICITMC